MRLDLPSHTTASGRRDRKTKENEGRWAGAIVKGTLYSLRASPAAKQARKGELKTGASFGPARAGEGSAALNGRYALRA